MFKHLIISCFYKCSWKRIKLSNYKILYRLFQKNWYLKWYCTLVPRKLVMWYLYHFNHWSSNVHCPVGWGCRIHQLHLCRGVTPLPNDCPEYDTKQSDGEVLVMLEPWGIWSIPSLPLLPGSLWPGMLAPDMGPIYGLDWTNGILMLNWIAWNRNVFDKPYLYLNCVLMLNWIILNKTVFWH